MIRLYGHIKKIVEPDPSIRGIHLYVDNRNAAAQQVYARLGMEGEHYHIFVWGEQTHVDFDQGLNWCIRRIREVLGDDANAPRFIQTVPRRCCLRCS